MIGILNYGLGNIQAFFNIYKSLDIPCKIVNNSKDLSDISKIILPGVGSFDFAMEKFNGSGLREKIENMVLDKKIPVLGICVGMQMLAKNSTEGKMEGLGWIDAYVEQISYHDKKLILPHMGWNDISLLKNNKLFENMNENDLRFYFLHSYYFKCNNNMNILAETKYGIKFTSIAFKENIYGVQFHPEKSHLNGVSLLKNFYKL